MGTFPLARLAALIAAIVLMAPASAFAQGAGDDQYQDPFPDTPGQTEPDDGLRDEPPGGGGGSGGSGSGGGSGGGSGSGSAGGAPEGSGQAGAGEDAAPGGRAAPADGSQLPNTGSEPILLGMLGSALLLIGTGLRLRTIDPDAF